MAKPKRTPTGPPQSSGYFLFVEFPPYNLHDPRTGQRTPLLETEYYPFYEVGSAPLAEKIAAVFRADVPKQRFWVIDADTQDEVNRLRFRSEIAAFRQAHDDPARSTFAQAILAARRDCDRLDPHLHLCEQLAEVIVYSAHAAIVEKQASNATGPGDSGQDGRRGEGNGQEATGKSNINIGNVQNLQMITGDLNEGTLNQQSQVTGKQTRKVFGIDGNHRKLWAVVTPWIILLLAVGVVVAGFSFFPPGYVIVLVVLFVILGAFVLRSTGDITERTMKGLIRRALRCFGSFRDPNEK
jgi:hypothetical protein